MNENLNCLRENAERYKTYSVPITKEVKRIDKNEKESQKRYCTGYNLLIVKDLSLSNLVDNLAEGIHKIKCKYGHDNEKSEKCGSKYKDCDCCHEYTNVKYDLIENYAAIRTIKKHLMKT